MTLVKLLMGRVPSSWGVDGEHCPRIQIDVMKDVARRLVNAMRRLGHGVVRGCFRKRKKKSVFFFKKKFCKGVLDGRVGCWTPNVW